VPSILFIAPFRAKRNRARLIDGVASYRWP